MTEYWVSKKQYWCKYCNIWIRDDAPSRKHHETGLKHQGSKERYIRDLYKTGNMAKHEKAKAEAEMARINAAAEAAYAKDTHLPGSGPVLSRMHPSAGASTSKARESSKPKDKWANYTSAKDLGFTEEADKTAYEVEQEVKGRAANAPGAWQVVMESPAGLDEEQDDVDPGMVDGSWGGKRKLGEYAVEDDEKAEGEEFKFAHRDKRPVRDPYDEDDWDPKAALGGLKFKSKDKGPAGTTRVKSEEEIKREQEGALDRAKWTGRLELNKVETSSPTGEVKPKQEGLAYIDGGWNQSQDAQASMGSMAQEAQADNKPILAEEDVKPDVRDSQDPETKDESSVMTTKTLQAVGEDVKPDVPVPVWDPAPPSNLFKKRRPPPSNRKK